MTDIEYHGAKRLKLCCMLRVTARAAVASQYARQSSALILCLPCPFPCRLLACPPWRCPCSRSCLGLDHPQQRCCRLGWSRALPFGDLHSVSFFCS